jgi:hypothetical protein
MHRENEKAKIIKKDLDLVTYQKQKLFEDLKTKKLDKVVKINKLIENSLKLYEELGHNEINHFKQAVEREKISNEIDMKFRLQEEELSNLEFEANKKVINLMNLRYKQELIKKTEMENEIKNIEYETKKRLLEEKRKTQDILTKSKLEKLKNTKQLELVKTRDDNIYLNKKYIKTLHDMDDNLKLEEMERERAIKKINSDLEFEKIFSDEVEVNNKSSLKKLQQRETENIPTEENQIHKNLNFDYNYNRAANFSSELQNSPIIFNRQKNNMNIYNEDKYEELSDYQDSKIYGSGVSTKYKKIDYSSNNYVLSSNNNFNSENSSNIYSPKNIIKYAPSKELGNSNSVNFNHNIRENEFGEYNPNYRSGSDYSSMAAVNTLGSLSLSDSK